MCILSEVSPLYAVSPLNDTSMTDSRAGHLNRDKSFWRWLDDCHHLLGVCVFDQQALALLDARVTLELVLLHAAHNLAQQCVEPRTADEIGSTSTRMWPSAYVAQAPNNPVGRGYPRVEAGIGILFESRAL